MELNRIHEMPFEKCTLPDKCAQLILADPPYYKVRGKFDFVWKTFDDYLASVELWAKAAQRILADNGTLFWWGDSNKIAYSQVILDKYFTLIGAPVWNKGKFMNLQEWDGMRSFAPATERLLMYSSQAMDLTGLQAVEKEFVAPRNPFAIELRRARKEKGISIKDVAEYGKFYGNVNHGGAVTNWESGYNIPSPEQWDILCELLPINMPYGSIRENYDSLRREYDGIRKEYENKRRYFNNYLKLTEVLDFPLEFYSRNKIDHETPKPEQLTTALILTCSRPGDLVVAPFSGSGTECAMAAKEGRSFIGYDTDPKNVENSIKRAQLYINTPTLF